MPFDLVLLGLIILFAWTTEATVGFGSMVLSVTLAAHLFAIKEVLPVLVALNILLGIYIYARHGQNIDIQLLTRSILPFMVLGAGVGFGIFYFWATTEQLKAVFGGLVCWFAGRELYMRLHPRATPPGRHPGWMVRPLVFAAGITHGIFASGGPLLVYALAGRGTNKTVFRSTLSAVWLIMNSVLMILYATSGAIGMGQWKHIGMFAGVVPLAILLGEFLHHRINEGVFQIIVFTLLLAAGLTLVGS